MPDNVTSHFYLDGRKIIFNSGDTIFTAANNEDVYIPHLCSHPDLPPHGSCRLCIVKVNGKIKAACVTPAENEAKVESYCEEINALRKQLIQMLFVDGNHFCPSCEMSGQCQLQAIAYDLQMLDYHYDLCYPERPLDCSHPDIFIDRDRCINCELCVRPSRQQDHKDVFSLGGRGQQTHLQANSSSGQLKDTTLSKDDHAMHVCPVGALLTKTNHFPNIAGERLYDQRPISELGNLRPEHANSKPEEQP